MGCQRGRTLLLLALYGSAKNESLPYSQFQFLSVLWITRDIKMQKDLIMVLSCFKLNDQFWIQCKSGQFSTLILIKKVTNTNTIILALPLPSHPPVLYEALPPCGFPTIASMRGFPSFVFFLLYPNTKPNMLQTQHASQLHSKGKQRGRPSVGRGRRQCLPKHPLTWKQAPSLSGNDGHPLTYQH